MKRKILAGTCILLALFFLVSCDTPTDIPGTPDVPGDPLPPKPPLPPDGPAPTDPGDITPPTPPPPPPDDEVVFDSVVDSNNQFALDLYSRYKEKEGNVFFSPFSISSALAMTYEGARGQTAYEIREVFHFPGIDVLRSGYEGIFQEINKADKDYKLHSANALWAEQDYVFIQDYFDTVEKYYSGGVTNLDFKTKPEESRVIINDRVEEKTEDLIKDLIPEGVITPLTRLVLTNAIYFKGTWVWQFDEEDTHEREFRVSGTETAQADMMYMANPKARYNYAETDELKILEMMYEGEELSMLLLLPKEDDLSGLEGSLSVDKLDGWKQLLRERKVSVFIPKFKFETKYFMADDLKEMGMPSAFDLPVRFGGPADFSGMTNDKDLSITEVIHQAFVEVNEEGTEAAAATGVVIGTTSAGDSLVFMADHPFIFIIQQRDSGNILFMGRVTDPT